MVEPDIWSMPPRQIHWPREETDSVGMGVQIVTRGGATVTQGRWGAAAEMPSGFF